MKKLIVILVGALLVAGAQAASVGWKSAGLKTYAGNVYEIFIIGQNGVDSIETVTALLDQKQSTSSYAFGTGTIASNGYGNVADSGETIGTGTWTSFMVLFDADSTEAANKYVVLSGASGQTQEVGASTALVTFGAGNMGSIANDSSNWKSYGDGVPEPTSGLLLLVGGALLALRRKQK